ncbi:MAG: hypothetical protein RRY36_00985 [Bacteroidaceae bacterium]
MSENEFIIVLTHHQILGSLLIPYYAKRESEDVLNVEEQAGIASLADTSLTDVQKKVVRLALNYSEKNLMIAYSNEKRVSDFFRKLHEGTLKTEIRPYIEKQLHAIIELVKLNNLSIYNKDAGKKVLYAHSRFDIPTEYTQANFLFEANDDYFRYSITCTQGGVPIELLNKKPAVVLSSQPACILLRSELLVFEEMKAARILPFLTRKYVRVDASETRRYLEKITLPVVQSYPTEAIGFEIKEEVITCVPELSFEVFNGEESVRLSFKYGDRSFELSEPAFAKYPRLSDDNNDIFYFCRDEEKENRLATRMETEGLKQVASGIYILPTSAGGHTLKGWVKAHERLFL